MKTKCLVCGKEFNIRGNRKKYCSDQCGAVADKKMALERTTRRKAKELIDKALSRKIKTLDDYIREAAACGLDYGNYRALIGQGKTFEEIKARYRRRQA